MAGTDEPTPRREPTPDRRGRLWLGVALATVALLACCCSGVLGLALAWSTGLFHSG